MLDRIGPDALNHPMTTAMKLETLIHNLSFRVFVSSWLLVAMALTVSLRAETGYDLWLRYAPLADAPERAAYRRSATAIVVESRSPTGATIVAELRRGLQGLLGVDAAAGGPPAIRRRGDRRHAIDVAARRRARLDATRSRASVDEGYVIRSTTVGGHAATVIASSGRGRRAVRRVPLSSPDPDAASRSRVSTSPSVRGWSGACSITGTISTAASSAATPGSSLWWPDRRRPAPRCDYARANASIGINGAVLNNVNAEPAVADRAASREGRGARATCSGPTASASTWPRTSRRRRCSAA